MSVSVVILGGGRIGTGNIGLAGDLPLSHLAAILSAAAQGVRLAGIVEPSAARRAEIAAAWPALPQALLQADITDLTLPSDCVAAICVPEAARLVAVEAALRAGVGGLLVEKPPARDRAELRRIADLARAAGVPLIFNFNRRFDPRISALRDSLPRDPATVIVTYARGLRNYASHFIDLLVYWFGRPLRARWLHDARRETADAIDPNPSFLLDFAGPRAFFSGFAELEYDMLDLDVIGADGRLTLRAGGAEIRRDTPVSGLYYKGYSHLSGEPGSAEPVGGFSEMYRLLGTGGMAALQRQGCGFEQAEATMAAMDAVMQSRAANGVAVELP